MDDLTLFFLFIFVLIIVLLILWLFFGGKEHKFEGLEFLDPPKRNNTGKFNTEESIYENVTTSSDGVCEIFDEPLITQNDTNTNSNTEGTEGKDTNSNTEGIVNTEGTVSPKGTEEESCIIENFSSPESTIIGTPLLVIPATRIKLPSLQLSYYENFSLNKNTMAHQERKTAAESRGEKLCRSIMENFYGKPFPTVRPDFLMNPETGKNLELDCFNEELGIALEYNGIQHYVYPNKFHKTEDEFEAQRARDDHKREQCKRSGIYLITVPYEIPHSKIPKFIEYNLPENVAYRQKHGIEGSYEDEFWSEEPPKMDLHGYI